MVGRQPATQSPPASNSFVRPLSGRCTGTLTASINVAVLVAGMTVPPLMAASLARDGITGAGLTRSLMTTAASFDPVAYATPTLTTARLACRHTSRKIPRSMQLYLDLDQRLRSNDKIHSISSAEVCCQDSQGQFALIGRET